MIVSENTEKAKSLYEFFENLVEKRHNVSKNIAKNVLHNPSQALDIIAIIATAAASKNLKNIL